MPELTFTRHFEDNWVKRVGNWPTRNGVAGIIERSVRIQPCRDLWLPDGTPYRVLAIYWHPELDLIIKVDDYENCAVTVMSRTCWRYDGEPLAEDKPRTPAGTPEPRVVDRPQVVLMHRPDARALAARALQISETFRPRRRAG